MSKLDNNNEPRVLWPTIASSYTQRDFLGTKIHDRKAGFYYVRSATLPDKVQNSNISIFKWNVEPAFNYSSAVQKSLSNSTKKSRIVGLP